MEANALTKYLEIFFDEVTPREFYRIIFPAGELEQQGEQTPGRYTGIIVAVTSKKKWNGRPKVKRYSITDDLDAVDVVAASDDFCLCSPISYAGKTRTADHARMLYGIAVDLDKLRTWKDGDPLGLRNLWERHIEALQRIPKPTFIVSSGTGLHLYYIFEKPIPLFRDTVEDLQTYKRELTRLIWHDTITDIKSAQEIQQEGIFQGFRMPGTITKSGSRTRAFQTGERVTVAYMNSFVEEKYQIRRFTYESRLHLEEAAEKYPDWYQRRIVEGQPRGKWATNRAVYDWWLSRIKSGATVGHRYYCVMMLAVYARKCSVYDPKHNPNPVTREELEADAFSLVDLLDGMTQTPDNHFGADDVQDALEAFDDRWITFPRNSISFKSGITIQANKRNGRKQEDHIRLMNFIRDELNGNKEWNRQGNGRKPKREAVEAWQREHPNGRKVDCIRETGLSRKTLDKYWMSREAVEHPAGNR